MRWFRFLLKMSFLLKSLANTFFRREWARGYLSPRVSRGKSFLVKVFNFVNEEEEGFFGTASETFLETKTKGGREIGPQKLSDEIGKRHAHNVSR